MVCIPTLNCHSCPWAVCACPIGVLAHFIQWRVFPWLALGSLLILGAIAGRAWCGWVCPFGLLQDLLYKLPGKKYLLPRWTVYLKYLVLIGSVGIIPWLWTVNHYAFFCRVCPSGTLFSLLPRALGAGDFNALAAAWVRLAILTAILLLVVGSSRGFCRMFCPLGAVLAIFNRFSCLSLRYAQQDCPRCQLCLENCPMEVKLEDFSSTPTREVVTAPPECILCLECTEQCQKGGLAINFGLWSHVKAKNESTDE